MKAKDWAAGNPTEAADEQQLLEWDIQEKLREHTIREEAKKRYQEQEAARVAAEHPDGRWMNLDEYLDGSYEAPQATVGAWREDGIQFLYPARWHTLIGLTTAAKTFFALWQAKAVMEDGGHVVYVHFEEANPNGTIGRLRRMGVDTEVIRKQFHWPESRPWTRGEMEDEIERLTDTPTLAVLDGINAACGDHGWNVSEPQSVGAYRSMFVNPLTAVGCTVLSLGHPVKNPGRQAESYSYGAAGWLNDVDGASYRLKASKETPIGRGKEGRSWLYSVKDREGNVDRWGVLQDDGDMPWHFQGSFLIDDSETGPSGRQHIKVLVPSIDAGTPGADKYDVGCERVLKFLKGQKDSSFKSQTDLFNKMAADTDTTPPQKADMAVVMERLLNRNAIEWPEVERSARPGRLAPSTDHTFDTE